MQWGGSLGVVIDSLTGIAVTVRGFGSYEGDVPKEAVLDALRAAVSQHPGDVLKMLADPAGIATAAQAVLAGGKPVKVEVAMLSLPEDDSAKLTAAVKAMRR